MEVWEEAQQEVLESLGTVAPWFHPLSTFCSCYVSNMLLPQPVTFSYGPHPQSFKDTKPPNDCKQYFAVVTRSQLIARSVGWL